MLFNLKHLIGASKKMKPYQLYMNKQKEVERLDKEINLVTLELDGLQSQRRQAVEERDEEQPGYYFEDSDMHVFVDHASGGIVFADADTNPICHMTREDMEKLAMHLLNWGVYPNIQAFVDNDGMTYVGQFIVPDFDKDKKKIDLALGAC